MHLSEVSDESAKQTFRVLRGGVVMAVVPVMRATLALAASS